MGTLRSPAVHARHQGLAPVDTSWTDRDPLWPWREQQVLQKGQQGRQRQHLTAPLAHNRPRFHHGLDDMSGADDAEPQRQVQRQGARRQ